MCYRVMFKPVNPAISTASEDIEFPGIGMAIIVDCSRIDATIEIVQRSSIWLIVNFEDDPILSSFFCIV